MKKYGLIVGLLSVCLGAGAQTYKHSIGIDVGTLYALSYKGFVFRSVPELAFQIDAGINVFVTAGTTRASVANEDIKIGLPWSKSQPFGRMEVYDLVIQPNFIYQKMWEQRDWGSISWYAGGGVNIGYMRENSKAYNYQTGQYDFITLMRGKSMRGKFGVNAVAGIELGFKAAPLALSFDFRPGYGLGWAWETNPDTHIRTNVQMHYLDWTVAIGLRYCLPQKHVNLDNHIN